jgi:hypothetical protein
MDEPTARGSGPFPNSLIDPFFERFRAILADANSLRSGPLLIAFLSGLGLICGITIFTGAVPTRVAGHDLLFLMDNGWRGWPPNRIGGFCINANNRQRCDVYSYLMQSRRAGSMSSGMCQ